MLPCPRCGRENPETALVCGGCRMPLALRDEPVPSRLDGELVLDRRGRDAEPSAEPEVGTLPADVDLDAGWPEPGPDGADAVAEPQEEDRGEEPPDHRPASAARRLAAWAIDGAMVASAALVPTFALVPLGGAGSTGPCCAFGSGILFAWLLSEGFVGVLAFVYFTVAHALAGATLGKRVARIRVVGEDGRPPAPAVSALRSGWAILSIALAGAGLLPALLLPSRRALHDLLAGTRVVEEP